MLKFIKTLIAFTITLLVTYSIGVLFITQINLNSIADLGIQISLSQRISTVGNDLLGMLIAYLPLLCVALVLAFSFTRFVISRFTTLTARWYLLAGFVGVLMIHQTLYWVFGMSPVAATRSLLGLLSQALAGGIGGWLYYHLQTNQRQQNSIR